MVHPARYTGTSRFGAMFLWTSFTFQVLWIFGSPNLSRVLIRADLAQIFIYSALMLSRCFTQQRMRRERERTDPRCTSARPRRGVYSLT